MHMGLLKSCRRRVCHYRARIIFFSVFQKQTNNIQDDDKFDKLVKQSVQENMTKDEWETLTA